MRILQLAWLWSGLILVAGSVEKQCNKGSSEMTSCTQVAVAHDYRGLDGCGILLQLENGTKLLPMNLDAFVSPGDGDSLRIDFTRVEGAVSICMSEDAIVRLTCLEVVNKATPCTIMVDPYRVNWSEKVMMDLDPHQVESLEVNGQPGYRFSGKSETRIYSCTGTLLCTYPNDDTSVCPTLLSTIRDAKVIYVVNE